MEPDGIHQRNAPLCTETLLYARAGRARIYTAETDARGHFILTNLPSGHYSANVTGDDLLPHSVPFDLRPGQNLHNTRFCGVGSRHDFRNRKGQER